MPAPHGGQGWRPVRQARGHCGARARDHGGSPLAAKDRRHAILFGAYSRTFEDIGMSKDRHVLLNWIEEDRDRLVTFLSEFLRTRSPNPPGDTRTAAAFVAAFLEAE